MDVSVLTDSQISHSQQSGQQPMVCEEREREREQDTTRWLNSHEQTWVCLQSCLSLTHTLVYTRTHRNKVRKAAHLPAAVLPVPAVEFPQPML